MRSLSDKRDLSLPERAGAVLQGCKETAGGTVAQVTRKIGLSRSADLYGRLKVGDEPPRYGEIGQGWILV